MGRPKYTENPDYKHIGAWSWNDKILWTHVEVDLDTTKCWLWDGSMSPTGALLGAWKNEVQQMTQARRLVYMSETGEDVTPYQITMTCQNQSCCNPNHFELKPTNRPEKQQW